MNTKRRALLQIMSTATLALALPKAASPVSARSLCASDGQGGPSDVCGSPGTVVRAAGDPAFKAWWVKTFLPTRTWPTPEEVREPVASVQEGRHFRVDGPQRGYRLLVWDPTSNEHVYIGAEAVGPVDPPVWSAFAEDGRWIDVNLSIPQHLKAMHGDAEVFQDLVTAGLQRRTRPGFYRILRRVENETMDSRTVPDATAPYLLKNVLFTQYFHGDGSAIHYNWWASSFGYPGSQGCLGMRMAGSKYMWDWATIGTPLAIHY